MVAFVKDVSLVMRGQPVVERQPRLAILRLRSKQKLCLLLILIFSLSAIVVFALINPSDPVSLSSAEVFKQATAAHDLNSLHSVQDLTNQVRRNTALPSYCDKVVDFRKRKNPTIEPIEPPWVAVMNWTSSDTVVPPTGNSINASLEAYEASGSKYVHVWASQTRRLGNQLFNYASLFGIAWRNKRIPLWPDGRTQLRSVFNLRVPIDEKYGVISSNESRFLKMREPGSAIYGQRTEHLPPESNVTLTVFLQSWRYFIEVEDQLRIDLTFRPEVIAKAQQFLDSVTPSDWQNLPFHRVVIHVRRGDYVSQEQQQEGWALPDPDYFNRSMAYFEACYPRVQFIVLSNDIKWCRRNIFGPRVVYSTGRTPTDDMALASLCDHAIVSIGSYGWWAAWFAGGVTITQKNFPTPNSYLLKRFNRTDFYKADWLSL